MTRHHTSIMRRVTSRIARLVGLTLLLGATALTLAAPVPVWAGGILPPLGTAASFGVLGGSAVTNTGLTTVRGNLGVSPGTAVSGFPPGIVIGTIHAGDAVAAQAQSDATIAYNNAAGQACDFNLTGQDLGGLTLAPGVYCFDSSAQLTGQLTLDGQNNPDSVFIFQIGSTLTTASNAQVLVINGAWLCRVFWQVGSSATLGTNTSFQGNILALTSITLNTGATTSTGLYALNGAVTLDTNDIQACALGATPTSTAIVTNTSTATAIPATNTPVPGATNTPVPGATNTPVPGATNTPLPGATNTPVSTAPATNTAIATMTTVPINTATSAPPTNTPGPGSTSTPPSPTVPTSTAIATSITTGTPADTATATPINTVTLSSPTVTLTITPLSTLTPGGPSATQTPGTPTQTLATQTPGTPTQSVTPPAATLTETPMVVPQPTPGAPSPPEFLPPTGGDPPWLASFTLLFSALLLAVGLGMHRRRLRTPRKLG